MTSTSWVGLHSSIRGRSPKRKSNVSQGGFLCQQLGGSSTTTTTLGYGTNSQEGLVRLPAAQSLWPKWTERHPWRAPRYPSSHLTLLSHSMSNPCFRPSGLMLYHSPSIRPLLTRPLSSPLTYRTWTSFLATPCLRTDGRHGKALWPSAARLVEIVGGTFLLPMRCSPPGRGHVHLSWNCRTQGESRTS